MKRSALYHKRPVFFYDESKVAVLVPFHKWALFLAPVLIFIVLPALFVWNSSKLIHPRSTLLVESKNINLDIEQKGMKKEIAFPEEF